MSARKASGRLFLREDVHHSGATVFKVDEEACVIHRVKILGWESENRRRYLPEAVNRSLYEGAQALCDHPARPGEQRKIRDLLGVFKNVAVERDGVYADLHYYKTHPMAGTVVEEAKRGLCGFGFSHNAEGDGYREPDGTEVINRIIKVNSVDLVLEPATVSSLRESKEAKMRTTFRAFLCEQLKSGPAEHRPFFRELFEAADKDDDKKCMEAEMDEPGDGDPMSAVVSAVASLAKTGDAGHHELATKIMKLIKPESVEEDEKEEPDADKGKTDAEKTKPADGEKKEEKEPDKDKKEARKPRTPVATTLTEAVCKSLCEGFGIKAEADLLGQMKVMSVEGATALLGIIKKNTAGGSGGKQPPRSQRTFTESRQTPATALPKTVDEAVAMYRRA